jgi:aryl-alcohol dehydrogenase-like predicted oxidoreductase
MASPFRYNTAFMNISRICLGAAQLGMAYGINNLTGKPSLEESRSIVRAAIEKGITAFDTAPAYGDSEQVLGRCLGGLPGEYVVVSKVPALDWRSGPAAIPLGIRKGIEATLLNLGMPRLGVCLFHRFDDMYMQGRTAINALGALKDEGLVEKIGCSVYTPDEAVSCLRLAACEAIQVPFNLADKRLLTIDFFRKAKAAGKLVFARSVYLQGLFFKRELPAGLADFEPFRARLEVLAAAAGLSLAEMALRYVLSVDGIDSVIIGVETAAQLESNLDMAGRGKLPERLVTEINGLGSAAERSIDPRQWPR